MFYQLNVSSNLRPSGGKAPNLPMGYHAPRILIKLGESFVST